MVGVSQLLLLLRQAGAQHSDGGVCASLPCQHQGSCTEILRPAPDAGNGGDGNGGHRILQSKDCSLKAVGAKTALINDECCGADDEACSEKGVPSSCDAGCAAVFLPFWHSCGSLFDSATYEPVVALCDAVPTPTPCDMAAVAAQTGEHDACKRDVLAEMRFHDGAVPRAADVDRECCGAGDADCAEGVPASCDTGCAAAFLPFWSSCGSMFDAATCECSHSLCVSFVPSEAAAQTHRLWPCARHRRRSWRWGSRALAWQTGKASSARRRATPATAGRAARTALAPVASVPARLARRVRIAKMTRAATSPSGCW